ncbi:MAG: zinc ribbon domain-containing protein [Candidatus Nitrosopumilus limneticus]|nr:zinc ribbon domain-containing protein [Thermoproteota archaeon]MDC4211869.1 zinc ribbon domain-containing protein [Candidatus Nitrosopumilus limneticus]HJJ20924.1 zinc ribbon domain-containing protein [Nitrosopumilus sp.]MDA0853728.1 zinc ribbon domain-containing protein [Thermoproteota archaeon]MDA1122667.1 zinc ribbon domain-containing protein [Thermoproteota archaeon]
MSFGEVDTLGMLFDKLQSLFDESQGYYESFLDTNNMYKKGQLTDKQFFQKLGDYTVAYSALEFLAIKVIFELKKAVDSGGRNTQSPGLMPGMGQPGMMAGGMGQLPRSGTAQNPVGRGPPGIVSAQEAFGNVGTLPSPDPALMPRQTISPQEQSGIRCTSCGSELRANSKFCTKCGTRA